MDTPKYGLRQPTERDASGIWQLIKNTRTLDLNSAYCYLLLCKYFAGTCAVAENEERQLVGFVSGYIPPVQQNTLFIWQVAVSEDLRGKGIARSLIEQILSRDLCTNVCMIEATVSATNDASHELFRKLASRLGTDISTVEGFSPDLFPAAHVEEPLLKIGPFYNEKEE